MVAREVFSTSAALAKQGAKLPAVTSRRTPSGARRRIYAQRCGHQGLDQRLIPGPWRQLQGSGGAVAAHAAATEKLDISGACRTPSRVHPGIVGMRCRRRERREAQALGRRVDHIFHLPLLKTLAGPSRLTRISSGHGRVASAGCGGPDPRQKPDGIMLTLHLGSAAPIPFEVKGAA